MDPVTDLKPLAPPTTEKPTNRETSQTTTPQSAFEGGLMHVLWFVQFRFVNRNLWWRQHSLCASFYYKVARRSAENNRCNKSNRVGVLIFWLFDICLWILGSRFHSGDNSSVFSPHPLSEVDATGKKRFVGRYMDQNHLLRNWRSILQFSLLTSRRMSSFCSVSCDL